MTELLLINDGGELYADSRDIAEAIERPHKELLRTIRTYCEYLSESKIALADFFVEAEYKDEQGKPRPCYFITKKGCDMIANKLTGKKGVLFTAAYVNAFEKMKEHLEDRNTAYSSKFMSAGKISSLLKNVRIVMERQESHPRDIARQTEIMLRHFGIPVIENFVKSEPWKQLNFEDKIEQQGCPLSLSVGRCVLKDIEDIQNKL